MTRSLLLQPRWVIAHVIILASSVAFVSLGTWQMRRLDEVRADNARVESRLEQAPVPLDRLDEELSGPPGSEALERLEYRQVRATGVYRPADEVLQRSRAHRGQNGYHVLTPLDLGDGRALLVRRGWVPFALDEPPVPEAAPPGGEVTVTGYLARSEQPSGIGPRDPATGTLAQVFHADVSRLDRQVDGDLLPMVLHAEAQSPPQPGRLPIPVGRPDRDESRHLSYALQWFSFALIAVVGYAAVLRKRTREHRDAAVDVSRSA